MDARFRPRQSRVSLLMALGALAPLSSGAAIVGGCFNLATLPASVADDAGPAADAGSSAPGTDASSVTTADAAANEGGSSEDAGGPLTSFCSTYVPSDWAVLFCSDFDPPELALPGRWENEANTGGSVAESHSSFVSPPNSLDEKVSALAAGDPIDVGLKAPVAFPALPSTMKLAFGVQPITVDVESKAAAILLASIDFLDASQRQYSLQLAGNVVGAALTLGLGEVTFLNQADAGNPPFVGHPLPAAVTLPLNAWATIVLEIKWTSPTAAQAIVSVNGTQQLTTPLTVTVAPASARLDIGTSFVAPQPAAGAFTSPWEIRYDNVVFTAD